MFKYLCRNWCGLRSKNDNGIFTDIWVIQPVGRELCEVKRTTKGIQVVKVLKITLNHNYKLHGNYLEIAIISFLYDRKLGNDNINTSDVWFDAMMWVNRLKMFLV